MFELRPDLPLTAIKALLGQPEVLDFRALDLLGAHRKLGEHVRHQVHSLLRRKFQEFDFETRVERVRLARNCRDAVCRKRDQAGDEDWRAALDEYVTCLSAWGQGADLAAFSTEASGDGVVDGYPVSADDLAYLLQDDEAGCQTGLWRAADGAAYLFHTEEDREPMGARFDRLRLMLFTIVDRGQATQAAAFIYPDLLPGPAFAWRGDNYIQAIDSLNWKPKIPVGGMLANVATWVALRLGKCADLDETTRFLGPFVDSYALNAVYADEGRVIGRKVEFAGTYTHSQRLGDAPGSYLFQVNQFSDPGAPAAQGGATAAPEKRRQLEERLGRGEGCLRALPLSGDSQAALLQFLCSQEGGDYACANRDVKAYLIARSSRGRLQVSWGAGPALAGDQPETFDFSP